MSDGDILRAGVNELIDQAYSMIRALEQIADTTGQMNATVLALGLQQSLNPGIVGAVNVHQSLREKLGEFVYMLNIYITMMEQYRDEISS